MSTTKFNVGDRVKILEVDGTDYEPDFLGKVATVNDKGLPQVQWDDWKDGDLWPKRPNAVDTERIKVIEPVRPPAPPKELGRWRTTL